MGQFQVCSTPTTSSTGRSASTCKSCSGSIVELCCAKKVFEWNSIETAGDYNFGIQFLPKDEEGQKRLRLAELKNGRLAMIAFGGAVTQAVITHNPFPWLY